ncbi:putative AC transposase [Bienertia sinuspersici]
MDNLKNTIDFSDDDDEVEEVHPPTSKPFQCQDGTYKRQRKLTSDVWAEFEFLEPDTNGVLCCKCKRCGQSYNAGSNIGTGNLRRHLDRCKKRKFRDVGQMILDCGSGGSGLLTSRSLNFDPTMFRELLATAIVRHELPFQFAEYEGVRKCFTHSQHDVKVVSRNTIKSDILQLYRKEKLKVKESLKCAPSRNALTSDFWSSITTDGYLSLTAHFIDDNWCLQKMILNFSFLPPPHTGLALCNHVCSLLQECVIQKKCFLLL